MRGPESNRCFAPPEVDTHHQGSLTADSPEPAGAVNLNTKQKG